MQVHRVFHTGAVTSLVILCVWLLAWEIAVAPLHPGGSLLALKALPLVLPLGGILQGRRYTYQWSSMLILAYFAEGVTRVWADPGLARQLAVAEVLLSLGYFAAAVSYARCSRGAA